MSAEQVAGPRTPGKSSGDIRWHGSQNGRVSLADRQIKVKRPRLRHREDGEVSVPAYESLQGNDATAQRVMGALLRGVSTREYAEVLSEMAEIAGVSRSNVGRQAIEGSVEQLRQLRERRWNEVDLRCSTLMGSALDRKLCGPPLKKCLARTNRYSAAAINKMRNVVDELPKEQQAQALNLMRADWRVSARFLEHQHESAARSLREGMTEMFTVQRLQLPPSLYKCLARYYERSSRVPKAACKRERTT